MPVDVSVFNAYWTFSSSSGIACDGPTRPFNNTTPPSAPNFAFISGQGTITQQFTVVNPGVHTVRLQSENRWYPAATETVSVLIDGVSIGTIPANSGFAWSARSFTTGVLVAGPHTLRFVGQSTTADRTMLIDSVTITDPSPALVTLPNGNFDSYSLSPDAYVYNPTAIATASYRLVASVTTCGKLLYCRITKISDGSTVAVKTINEAPVLSINGLPAGAVRIADPSVPMISTAVHPTFLIPLPAGVVVSASDTFTLSASEGWVFGPTSYSEAMTAQPVANRVGRSFVRTVDVPRTMGIGMPISPGPEWANTLFAKNQRCRLSYWVPQNVSNDAGGMPIVMGATTAIAPVINLTQANNVDSTGYPTPTGLWGLPWDDLDGGTTFGLDANGDSGASFTLVGSVDLAITGGTRRFRVYDVRRTGSVTNFALWLRLTKDDRRPHFANLAILAPGDFAWTPGQTTIPPTPAWSDLSVHVTNKAPTSLPFSRNRMAMAGYELGNSSACEREHVVEPSDFHWTNDTKVRVDVAYVQARPWTNAASPYIYDPLAGTDFTATLSAPITTAPASGTIETITISDAATAPVIAGLVLTIGSERLRVKSVSGTTVTVMRGVEGTTPALHPLSPPAILTISVSARRAMPSLASFAISNRQITELVTQSPHGLKTGQAIPFQGNGWVSFTYTDGNGFFTRTPGDGGYHGFSPFFAPVYVTGASTFVVAFSGPGPQTNPNVTLSTAYMLQPTGQYACYSQMYLPEDGGQPYELQASASAQYPGAAALANFCVASSDDMVDSIWRRMLPYIPADRDFHVEYSVEPWNFAGKHGLFWQDMGWQLYGRADSNTYWHGVRLARIRDRGRAIWVDAGRDPSHIKCAICLQDTPGIAGGIGGYLDFLAAQSALPNAIAIAPYYDLHPDLAIWKAFAAWSTDMLVDAWIWDFHDNTDTGLSQLHRVGDFNAAIVAWNSAHGGAVDLEIYEYGPQIPWPNYGAGIGAAMDASTTTLTLSAGVNPNPLNNASDDAAKIQPGSWIVCGSEWMTVVSRSGATCTVVRGQGGTTAAAHAAGSYCRNDWIEGTMDLTLHPNFRFAHFDAMAFFQSHGVMHMMPSSMGGFWYGGNAWADYHAIDQLPGMGDGSDGKANNLLCLARRGQPNSKPRTVNYDVNTVSVRGQAMIDFLAPPAPPSGSGHRPGVIRRRKGRMVMR